MIKTLSKTILNETLVFTNHKAVFWEKEKLLIISDLHVGKAAHFRKNGIAISSEILEDDLKTLENLIQYFSAEKLIIVGDFLHAGKNSDFDIFCDWRAQFSDLKIILIKGNHDRFSNTILENLCIDIFENELEMPPFSFIHEPQEKTGKFVVSGHIHPGVLLELHKKNSLNFRVLRIRRKA